MNPATAAKLGLYGKGTYDITKARADIKKATAEAEKKLQQNQGLQLHCTAEAEGLGHEAQRA